MKERPIIFSGPMVRALLAGTKTQTRRVVKPVPSTLVDGFYLPFKDEPNNWHGFGGDLIYWYGSCPYGQPGDRLWVREAWMDLRGVDGAIANCMFRATFGNAPDGGKWRPSIHMPRWASRITLEVTGVRVERLQDISTSDAEAEGWPGPDAENSISSTYPIAWYSKLWEEINGPGSWTANPWVWCVAFRRLETAC